MSAARDGALNALTRLSVSVGQDPLLVQGPGGNTSVKIDNTLWVKASGAWLGNAEQEAVFVPVDHAMVLGAIAAGEEKLPAESALPGGAEGLRASIETTLHALMPHRYVAHTHAVNTMAQASLAGVDDVLEGALDGLRWAHVPYCRPGLPLTLRVRDALATRPIDVLVLGNHGLVVGADDADAALALTHEVERRLAMTARAAQQAPDTDALRPWLAQGATWRLPNEAVSHAVAFDADALQVARAGSLYPDHVIFLGHAIATPDTVQPGAPAVAVPGAGVLLDAEAPPAADWMVHALSEVATRLRPSDQIRYLEPDEEAALLNWDAEKYRKTLARRGRAPSVEEQQPR